MNDKDSKIIKRIIELHREENRLFLESVEQYEKYGRKESINEVGEHGYASTVLAKLLIEFV